MPRKANGRADVSHRADDQMPGERMSAPAANGTPSNGLPAGAGTMSAGGDNGAMSAGGGGAMGGAGGGGAMSSAGGGGAMGGGGAVTGGGGSGGAGGAGAGGGRPGGGGGAGGGMPGGGGGMSGGDPGRADQPPTRRECGVMDVHRRLLSTSAEYVAARSALENATTQYVARQQRFAGIAKIPVVVHVVWNTAAQNISQAQIDSQIAVLNRDFRATNTDIGFVPAPFQPLVADAKIEFALATTDPNGNPTTGVTRTQTSQASFGTDDKVKKTATGGIDAWNPDKYLNLWVCQLGGGLLG